MDFTTTYHDDGNVTYWSVYNQHWALGIPPVRELAAMQADERNRTIRHVRTCANPDNVPTAYLLD